MLKACERAVPPNADDRPLSIMSFYRFNVFGRIIGVQREGTSWQAYALGADGKRSAADSVVPDFIEAHELAQYLADLFYERATPANADVRKLD